jgi:hypothetical protein
LLGTAGEPGFRHPRFEMVLRINTKALVIVEFLIEEAGIFVSKMDAGDLVAIPVRYRMMRQVGSRFRRLLIQQQRELSRDGDTVHVHKLVRVLA